jgi:uncharacterized protein (TIGR03435 family)
MTAWTDVIGWTLVHFVWEGTLIALICAGVLRAMRRASARARYAAACAGLLAALTAPPVTVVVLTMSDSAPRTGVAAVVLSSVASVHTGSHGVPQAATASFGGVRPVPVDNNTVAALLSAFVSFWAAGVVLLTARLASGWWRVRRLHAEAMAAPQSHWLAAATQIAGKLGLSRAIHVADSLHVDTPTVIGWLRPVVLLPAAALANLTPAQVEAILAHELAHIRRHDFIVNLLQTVAEIVLFYHPAVWWLSTRIRAEREHCCDDIAVDVCGDAVGYAEALTALAAWGRMRVAEDRAASAASPLAVAATDGTLLYRVRRLLRLPEERERRPVTALVVAVTVLLVILAGTRLVIVAQTPQSSNVVHMDRRLGPTDINRLVGFDLFPGPPHYATDDPKEARAWDVKVAFPGGEMAFMGFTGRGVVRYAYALDGDVPVVDAPQWLDMDSRTIRGETSAGHPDDEDFREAIRVVLEGQYGMSIRRDVRLFPVYGLQVAEKGRLGPNIRPSEAECFESQRDRLDTIGPSLHARGQQMQFCGVDHTIRGPKGYRVTMAALARSLRGFNMGPVESAVAEREVVDQTGLTGVYDFELSLGFLPLAVVASGHPTLAIGLGPMIRTFPQAIEEQLGLRLVPADEPRDVVVIVTAPQRLPGQAAQAERTPGESGANQAH